MSGPPSPNQPHLSTNTSIMKKRRGRQPRQSLVSASLHQSIVEFAHKIGSPSLYSDFRDFSGWNQRISGAQYEPAWRQLAQDVLRSAHDIGSNRLSELKRDVIFDIMPLVVKKKPHETDKLVSTNARRQLINNKTSRHPTLMTMLETHINQLKSVSNRSSAGAGSSSMAVAHTQGMSSSSAMGAHTAPRASHSSASDFRRGDRSSSSGSSSRSGDRHSVKTSTAMEIATLLSGEASSSGMASSSQHKLPSFTQLDAHIQARKEREKRDKRYRR
ncbi:hypothetical protein FGB62_14g17 [Gracilaria domingensis]|nr:hypothetical protein FGB62_14g17 [Gracilaria domingensis]